jgi:hypothetical protein
VQEEQDDRTRAGTQKELAEAREEVESGKSGETYYPTRMYRGHAGGDGRGQTTRSQKRTRGTRARRKASTPGELAPGAVTATKVEMQLISKQCGSNRATKQCTTSNSRQCINNSSR